MANGSLFGDIKSRFGIGARNDAADDYDEGYEEYDEYDEYDEYNDDYEDDYDPYMDRNPVTTRDRGGSSLPRLVSMGDARESARSSFSHRDGAGSSGRSSVRSYGRTMVDSSLPSSMTAEGAAATSAAANSKRGFGLDSLFSTSSRSTSRSGSSDLIRNSMQLSMPGMRKLQVIKPVRYDDAEAVTSVLKENDVAVLNFAETDRDLMKRILDFSFGAASALDASVESVGNGVFVICRSVGLDENERADLKKMGLA